MKLTAAVTRITDATSTLYVFGPNGATPVKEEISHQPGERLAAAEARLTEQGFQLTDSWRRLGKFVETWSAHVAREAEVNVDLANYKPGVQLEDLLAEDL